MATITGGQGMAAITQARGSSANKIAWSLLLCMKCLTLSFVAVSLPLQSRKVRPAKLLKCPACLLALDLLCNPWLGPIIRYPGERTMRQSLAITAFAIVLAGYTASVSAATITYTDFSAFQAAAPSLTTETFETAPWAPENLQIQGTSNLGVTWTSADTLSSTSFNSSDLSITSLDGGFDSTDFLQAVLPANITAVGGWVSSFNLDHDTDLRAYDGSDTLLGSISLGNTGNAYAFFGVTSDVEIAKVIFVATNVTTDDDFALDDFAFGGPAVTNPNPVPEPATLTLLGAALGLLGWRRRR